MDRKTLEYLGDRVERGKKLVKEIEALKKELNQVQGRKHNYAYVSNIHVVNSKIIESIVGAFIESANAEIKRLEDELAEL